MDIDKDLSISWKNDYVTCVDDLMARSSDFERSCAQALAAFQRECTAHHNAFLKHLREELLHLRGAAVADGKDSSPDGFQHRAASPYGFSAAVRTSDEYQQSRLPASKEADEAIIPRSASGQPAVHSPGKPASPKLVEFEEDASPASQSAAADPAEDEVESEQGTQMAHVDTARTSVPAAALNAALRRWAFFIRAYALLDLGIGDEDPLLTENLLEHWEVEPVWCDKNTLLARRRRRMSQLSKGRGRAETQLKRRSFRTGDKMTSASRLQSFVVEPSSFGRLIWVIFGAFIIFFELLIIPMGPFVDWESLTMKTLHMLTMIYWILDLPLNFFIGFLDNGLVEMRPNRIASQYIKTWFIPDVALVCGDLFLYVADISNPNASRAAKSGKTARMGRTLRLVRTVRLLRLMKLSRTFCVLLDNMTSQYAVLSLKLCLHLFVILGVNHYAACGFFFIGKELASNGSDSWVVLTGLEDAEPHYQYLMSLHWSVTQFTPATNDINPACAEERGYAILVVLFALVIFSSFVSSVTNTVNEMRRINMERASEEGRLREFISKRRFSQELAMLIWFFFRQHYIRRKRAVIESDIRFFLEVPQSLREHMHKETYMPVVRLHGALNMLRTVDTDMITKICHACFNDYQELPSHDIFTCDAECSRILFIVEGRVVYYRTTVRSKLSGGRPPENQEGSSSKWSQQHEIEVIDIPPQPLFAASRRLWLPNREETTSEEKRRWMSEATLWVPWKHRGQLTTDNHVEMIELDCRKFHELFTENAGLLWQALRHVAVFFVQFADEETQSGRCITDINVSQDLMGTLAERALTYQEQQEKISKHLARMGSS